MSSSGARVFVRLYDGAAQREGDAQLVMLPPPPLTWKRVLAMMVMAVTKQDTEPDDQELASVRLFLLPTDAQGIVAELNARALRFGVRDNDQFAICLRGEEYMRVEPSGNGQDDDADAVAALAAMAAVTGPLPSVISMKARLNDDAPSVETTAPSAPTSTVPSSSSSAPPHSNLFSNAAAPPAGTMMMDHSSAIRKATKRYRSISGKMAAIKSLGDKGLISAEDRGHLKDLLLNNDSPALQEALDAYQNTGDFQAVKDLLMKELRNPSNKRGTSDWLPESLINDLSENFQTHDAQDGEQSYGRYGQQGSTGYNTAQPANPFMHSTQSAAYESPSASSDYTTVTDDDAVHPVPSMGATYEQQQAWSTSESMSTAYAQQPQTTSMGMYASTTPPAQINLPLRDRNSVNLMLKHRAMDGTTQSMDPIQASMMHGNPVEIGYVTTATPYATGYTQGYAPVSYATASTGYSYPGMSPYGTAIPTTAAQAAYGAYYAQPGAVAYSMSPYGHPQYANVAAMQGYSYYGAAAGAYGYLKPGQPGRIGGKWTTVPPMPAYPPPCSKEEKKEKIARWLKKRENRNWSNKPSYPVRHNIAKNRKRGEDGRFITKARLAEMEAEAAAQAAADGGDREDGSGSESETNAMPVAQFDASDFPPLPQATPVHN